MPGPPPEHPRLRLLKGNLGRAVIKVSAWRLLPERAPPRTNVRFGTLDMNNKTKNEGARLTGWVAQIYQ